MSESARSGRGRRWVARLRVGAQVGGAVVRTALSRWTRRSGSGVPDQPAVAPPRQFGYAARAAVEVRVPPEQVYAVLTDVRRMPEWLTMHVGWPSEPPAEPAEGVSFRQQLKLMGVPAQVRWTVVGVEQPRLLWLDASGPMRTTIGCYFSLGRTAGGTLVSFDGGIEGESVTGPVGPMVARTLGDAMQRSLEKLAALAVDGSPASAPAAPAAAAQARTVTPRRTPAPSRPKPAPVRYARTGEELDPWTPVIVGVGQLVNRDTGTAAGHDPASLAATALRRAAEDSGVGEALLAQADSVRFVASVSHSYADGAALIAEALGVRPAETVQTSALGGDGSQRLINDTAQAIADGAVQIALLGGAESGATAASAERAAGGTDWPEQPHGTRPTRLLGIDRTPNNDAETAAGLVAPIYLYALLETALRGRHGTDPQQHLAEIAALWSRFAGVAAGNPYAWAPELAAEASADPSLIATPTPENRPIAAPYPKLLTANLQVDLATGLIMCSAAAAQAAGVPQEKWVFVHAGGHAVEEWYVSERADLADSPAIRAMGAAALRHAGLTIDQIRHIDLYACFPSAVRLAADALGLPTDDPDRPLTLTGGLTFAGGPGNNYTSHAVANLVPKLRAEPDAYGLATAVGWYMTKNAIGIYSA
ncbi:MAG: type II toxin-antitoxin system Rv0910 family toxin, partial [Micromonosporaceae bacterium]